MVATCRSGRTSPDHCVAHVQPNRDLGGTREHLNGTAVLRRKPLFLFLFRRLQSPRGSRLGSCVNHRRCQLPENPWHLEEAPFLAGAPAFPRPTRAKPMRALGACKRDLGRRGLKPARYERLRHERYRSVQSRPPRQSFRDCRRSAYPPAPRVHARARKLPNRE